MLPVNILYKPKPPLFEARGHALRRGRAVNDDRRGGSHRPMQELRPNTPASAVATATIGTVVKRIKLYNELIANAI